MTEHTGPNHTTLCHREPFHPVKCRAVILISGSGSNLQAIIAAQQAQTLNLDIRLVISNRADAPGLERTHQAGLNTLILLPADFPSRQDYDRQLQLAIDNTGANWIILAGFMRILSDAFVEHYQGRLINIHPSLLPEFRGLNTHQRVLDAGRTEHGASVHFVVPELDAGPILLQGKVPVLREDDAKTLAARVLAMEHKIYPLALQWICDGRVKMVGDRITMDGSVLSRPQMYNDQE